MMTPITLITIVLEQASVVMFTYPPKANDLCGG